MMDGMVGHGSRSRGDRKRRQTMVDDVQVNILFVDSLGDAEEFAQVDHQSNEEEEKRRREKLLERNAQKREEMELVKMASTVIPHIGVQRSGINKYRSKVAEKLARSKNIAKAKRNFRTRRSLIRSTIRMRRTNSDACISVLSGMTPKERFIWSAKKVLWRLKQKSKAILAISRGRKRRLGQEVLLVDFGSPQRKVNANNITIDDVKVLYASELARRSRYRLHGGSDMPVTPPTWGTGGTSVQSAPVLSDLSSFELWIRFPKLKTRQMVTSSVYLQRVLQKYEWGRLERKHANIHRILQDFSYCLQHGEHIETAALGIWQFAIGTDFDEGLFIQSGSAAMEFLVSHISQHPKVCVGAIWALAQQSSDILEFLVACNAVQQVVTLVQQINDISEEDQTLLQLIVGALCCFSCCKSGAVCLGSIAGVHTLLRLLGNPLGSEKAKYIIIQTLTSCWPYSHGAMIALLQQQDTLGDITSAIDVLVNILQPGFCPTNTGAISVLAQIGTSNPSLERFLEKDIVETLVNVGTGAYLAREKAIRRMAKHSNHSEEDQYRGKVIDVALQCIAGALGVWMGGSKKKLVSLFAEGVLNTLRKMLFIKSSEFCATLAITKLFVRCIQVKHHVREASQLLLSRIRLSTDTQVVGMILKNTFFHETDQDEIIQTLNHHGALHIVLNLIRKEQLNEKIVHLSAAVALKLALDPSSRLCNHSNIDLLLHLLDTSRGDARNALLCVLYGLAIGADERAEANSRKTAPNLIYLSSKPANFDTMLRALGNVSVDFTKPFFQVSTLIVWHMFEHTQKSSNHNHDGCLDLGSFANTIVAHLCGNCSHLRAAIKYFYGSTKEAQNKTKIHTSSRKKNEKKAFFQVTFEEEIQMWTVISLKRSILESNKNTPIQLRGVSSIIGFYETEREAMQAYIEFEEEAQELRQRSLVQNGTTIEQGTLFGLDAKPSTLRQAKISIKDAEEPVSLLEVATSVSTRARLLVSLTTMVLLRSKELLDAETQDNLERVEADIEKQKQKRLTQYKRAESCLRDAELDASRKQFQKMERLQARADKAKLETVAADMLKIEGCVYETLMCKEIVGELFYIGFCKRFDPTTKRLAVWLLWDLLFRRERKRLSRNAKRDGDEEEGEHADDDEMECEEDELEVSDEEEDHDGSDDCESNPSTDDMNARRKIKSVRQRWNENVQLLFGRPSNFYQIRFAAVLVQLAEMNTPELQLTAAKLLARLADLSMLRSKDPLNECGAIAKANCVETLVKLLKSKQDQIRYNAAQALWTLSTSLVYQEMMSCNGGLNTILKIVVNMSQSRSTSDKNSYRKQTEAIACDILSTLRRNPCNGTRFYQAEMKGVSQDILRRPTQRWTFNPAVSHISISSTPRTKGAYKVKLEPILFKDPDERLGTANCSRASRGSTRGSRRSSFVAEDSQYIVKTSTNMALQKSASGPTFVFRNNKKKPGMKRTASSTAIVEETNGRGGTTDEFWHKTLSKFDKVGNNILDEVPVFAAPDGQQFHLFLQSAPPKPTFSLDVGFFDKECPNKLGLMSLEHLCTLLKMPRKEGENLSSLLLRFCELRGENSSSTEGQKNSNEAMVSTLHKTTVDDKPIPFCAKKCHRLLGHVGSQLGKIVDNDCLEVFLVPSPETIARQIEIEKSDNWEEPGPSCIMSEYSEDMVWDLHINDQRCVASDWDSRPHPVFKESEDAECSHARTFLISHATLIIGVFRYYAVDDISDDLIFSVSKISFRAFLEDIGVISVDHPFSLYEAAFDASCREFGGEMEVFQNTPCFHKGDGTSLLRFQFLDCLLRVAVCHFPNIDSKAFALEALFQDRIVPVLRNEALLDPNVFRVQRLYRPDTNTVLHEKIEELLFLFRVSSGKVADKKDWGGLAKERLSFPDFIHWLTQDAEIMGFRGALTREIAAKAFAFSCGNIPNYPRDWMQAITLDPGRFLEALARLADLMLIPTLTHLKMVKTHSVQQFYGFLKQTEFMNVNLDFEDNNASLLHNRYTKPSIRRLGIVAKELDTRTMAEKLRIFIELVLHPYNRNQLLSGKRTKKKQNTIKHLAQCREKNKKLDFMDEHCHKLVQTLTIKVAEKMPHNSELENIILSQNTLAQINAVTKTHGFKLALENLDVMKEVGVRADIHMLKLAQMSIIEVLQNEQKKSK